MFKEHQSLLFCVHRKDDRMPRKKKNSGKKLSRRQYTDKFKEEAVQLLLEGDTAPQVVDWFGISNANCLYRWKQEQLEKTGPMARSLEARSLSGNPH